MTVRAATVLTFVFLITMTVAVTWPGLTLFNRIEPRVLGLPFNFAWVSGWIVVSFFVLVILERATSKASGSGDSPSVHAPADPEKPSRGES